MVCRRCVVRHPIHFNLTNLCMMLIVLLGIPGMAGLLCWLTALGRPQWAKWIALVAMLTDLALTVSIWTAQRVPLHLAGHDWMINYQLSWIPAMGINFHLAVDGLSVLMLTLTFFLGTLAVLCSWNEIRERIPFYFFN